MTNTQIARGARSNSLQRMLELEKQVMNQRMQSLPPDTSRPSSSRSGKPASQTDSAPQTPVEETSRGRPRRPSTSRPPPLVINSSHPRLNPSEDSKSPPARTPRETPFVTVLSEKPSPKVVAFQFPPEVEDRKALCQSPTWEAYGRNKREKKERREDQREKKREEKREEKKTQEHKRRLTKPPPTHQNPHMVYMHGASAVPVSPKQRSRSASAVGGEAPLDKDSSGRAPRSRSRTGSFTSLLRSFEVRRNSVDHARDNGFIGGIKLEQKKHEAEQKAIDADLKAIEANIHPALRQSKPNSRTSSPLRSPAFAKAAAEDPNQKHYPPITRQPISPKNRSFSFSSQTSRAELTTMDKLRACVGLKPGTKDDKTPLATPKSEQAKRPHVSNGSPLVPQSSHDPVRRLAHAKVPSTSAIPTPPKPIAAQQVVKKTSLPNEFPGVEPLRLRNRPGADEAQPRTLHHVSPTLEDKVRTQDIRQQPRDITVDSAKSNAFASWSPQPSPSLVPPPLEPPKRSSRRKSRLLDAEQMPSSPVSSMPKAQDAQPAWLEQHDDYFSSFNRPYTPPTLELRGPANDARAVREVHRFEDTTDSESQHSKKRTIKSAAKAAFRFAGSPTEHPPRMSSTPVGTKKLSQVPDMRAEIMIQPRLNLSATDDSYSEASRYSTDLSTPNSSQPSSEQDLSRPLQKPPAIRGDAPASPTTTIASEYQKLTKDIDFEDDFNMQAIQAAAEKVRSSMERRSRPDLRGNSIRPDLLANAPPLPKPKQPWKSKEKLRGQIPTPPESESDDAPKYPLPVRPGTAPSASKSTTSLHNSRRPPPSPLTAAPISSKTTPDKLPTPPPQQSSRLSPKPRDAPASPLRPVGASKVGDQVAKMFVECCSCRYYHDMPSRLYEAMVHPDTVLDAKDSMFAGSLSMTVKCPWCRHEMSTKCCAGLAAMVHVKERLH
ncbi:hypothetical protein B0I35DRAFT_410563 [Stachybotrys elegans]|uniref:Uncharacterized protein n=1 Tax=Stachybotrys elegans TaxID=80388 RepID=A0A8K0SNR2_9HYPO|nr:hypothetical protein B0I35DRAFT_410563 [Stachybotrys elegans]